MSTVTFEAIAPVLNVNSRTMKPTLDLLTEKLGFEIDTVVYNAIGLTGFLLCLPMTYFYFKFYND